jgi:hypothetical protein
MFNYQLELEDGAPAGHYTATVPNWKPGDAIPLGPGKSYAGIDVSAHATLNGTLVVRSVTYAPAIRTPQLPVEASGRPISKAWGVPLVDQLPIVVAVWLVLDLLVLVGALLLARWRLGPRHSRSPHHPHA